MFKSKKKRQQQKLLQRQAEEEVAAAAAAAATEIEMNNNNTKYKLLDDIHLTHDFRSSVILPQLNKDLDPLKLSHQQQHLAQLRDIPESPTSMAPPLSPSSLNSDGTTQYQDLAAWRHQRSQNRYSNGLFGGKQRGRPKPNQIQKLVKNQQGDLQEVDDEEEEKDNIVDPQQQPSFSSILNQVENFSEDEEEDSIPQERYEPDSDTEENFFFQDFSANPTNKKPGTKKSARNKKGRRSQKVMSKFDLSSFAKDLHEHRLSVIQPRESTIIMTEDDELELERLLERQRQRMSMMTVNSAASTDELAPPMPSLDLIKPHIITPVKEVIAVTEQMPVMNSDHGSTTTNSMSSSFSVDLISANKKESEDDTQDFINTAQSPKPMTSVSSSSTGSSSYKKVEQLKRSASITSIRSNYTIPKPRTNLSRIDDIVEIKQKSRRSMSLDNIHIKMDENEPSVTSAALEWITQDNSSDPTSFNYKKSNITTLPLPPPPIPQQSKSRSLFGSLRQVSRSKSHHQHSGNGSGVTSIKGLVRNFSSSHKSSSSRVDRNQDAGISRAAMAVIQHNVAKHEQKKAASVIPADEKSEIPPDHHRHSRSKADSNGSRLISQLLARAASHPRKHNATKIVNMEQEEAVNKKKRAEVVRRTIIYVQPDSLHDLLKNGGDGSSIKSPVPPVPSLPLPRLNTRNTIASSDGSLSPDDETIRSKEYFTATKVTRQTSVKKRVVETEGHDEKKYRAATSPLSREGSNNTGRKRWQLKNVSNDSSDSIEKQGSSSKRSSSSSASSDEYLEGVELREMSDGSVVWGLVKKQGNRKSFFAPNKQNGFVEEEEEDEEIPSKKPQKIYNNNALSPPPIPKRSPRRQIKAPTTDIYYSNEVTLPNLLKMMQEQQQQHPGDDVHQDDDFDERAMASVDDQLDEMMRILTSQ